MRRSIKGAPSFHVFRLSGAEAIPHVGAGPYTPKVRRQTKAERLGRLARFRCPLWNDANSMVGFEEGTELCLDRECSLPSEAASKFRIASCMREASASPCSLLEAVPVQREHTSMPIAPAESDAEHQVSTGISGLDNVLCGGLDSYRLYLVEGEPGTGKTTLALQFLLEGARRGETGLYVTLSESDRELRLVAKRHGWTLDNVSVFELVPPEAALDPEKELTLFHPAEMELSETTKLILTGSHRSSRSEWFLTASPKCGSWHRIRYGIDGRFSH
jgi:hypothetical protein